MPNSNATITTTEPPLPPPATEMELRALDRQAQLDPLHPLKQFQTKGLNDWLSTDLGIAYGAGVVADSFDASGFWCCEPTRWVGALDRPIRFGGPESSLRS